MIGTPMELRSLVTELEGSTWTLAALGALFEAGIADHLREPRSMDDLAALCPGLARGRLERCLAVLATVGVVLAEGGRFRVAAGALPFLGQPLRAAIEGDIRTHMMQALAFLDSSSSGEATAGWNHTEAALLQSQGDASSVFAPMFKASLAPTLSGLVERLERRGARFLDVGTGVGALAIAMARVWPELHTVGLDCFEPSLALARRNVARADLGSRIELRLLAAQDLRDETCFDLAWLPSFFIAPPLLPAILGRISASLRPGGWVIVPITVPAEDRSGAIGGLLVELWGGSVLTAAQAESLLSEAGLSSVRTVPGPVSGSVILFGQRAV